MKITNVEIHICNCLEEIIVKKLNIGNSIRTFNETPEWPEKDSRFVFLDNKINSISLKNLPEWVFIRVNNDMHYTWYNEIYCKKHHDLLAAGDM